MNDEMDMIDGETAVMHKPLVSYVGGMAWQVNWFTSKETFDPHTVFYSQIGNVGVYWISDRDRRNALLSRHYDEHGCPNGIAYCEEGMRLFNNLHPDDQVLLG